AGRRIEAVAAPDLIAVRMYTGWRSLAEGLIKNAVAGFQSGGARSAFVGIRQAPIAFLPVALLLAGGVGRYGGGGRPGGRPGGSPLQVAGAALAGITLASYAWLARRRYRLGVGWGLLYPLGLAIYFGLAGVGFIRLRTGRGVVWKGRVLR